MRENDVVDVSKPIVGEVLLRMELIHVKDRHYCVKHNWGGGNNFYHDIVHKGEDPKRIFELVLASIRRKEGRE